MLEDRMQLQWKCFWREEAKALEQQGRVKGSEASQDKILGEGHYADPQSQAIYNEHILSLCHTAALNACDMVKAPARRIESYAKLIQGQREFFSDFLRRLTKGIKTGVTDSEAR